MLFKEEWWFLRLDFKLPINEILISRESANCNYIMINIQGGSLLDALKTHGRQYLPNSKLISFCKQIGSGLLYLKNNQIIHRDIAARNIFLSKDLDIAKIGDFGLAITTTEIATLPRDIDTLLASKIAVKVSFLYSCIVLHVSFLVDRTGSTEKWQI